MGIGGGATAIEVNRSLVFGNGLAKARLRTQHLALGIMWQRAVRRSRQGPPRQLLGALQIGVRRLTELIAHADRKRDRQPSSRIRRIRVEGQRSFEEGNRLFSVF